MKYGNINAKGLVKPAWQEIYKTTMLTTTNSISISGLNGDTDILYRVSMRGVNPNTANSITLLRLNNDSTADIYGVQYMTGNSTSVDVGRYTDTGIINCAFGTNDGIVGKSITLIYAKSGYIRPVIVDKVDKIGGVWVVQYLDQMGYAYNDTTNNITSMTINASQAGAIGIGTYVCLERLNL